MFVKLDYKMNTRKLLKICNCLFVEHIENLTIIHLFCQSQIIFEGLIPKGGNGGEYAGFYTYDVHSSPNSIN